MSIIEVVSKCFEDAIRADCSDDENKKCKAEMTGYNNYIILKGETVRDILEKSSLNGKKSNDCFVFINEINEELIISIVEFKSRSADVEKIRQQLESGSKYALSVLGKCKIYCNDDEKKCLSNKKICHIAVAEEWHPSKIRMMKDKKVSINGGKYPILTKECGTKLQNVVPKFAKSLKSF